MKNIDVEILGGLKYTAQGYSSVAEMTADAGGEDKLVDRMNGFLVAHGTNGEARAIAVDVVSKATGVTRKTKPVLDKDGKPKTKDGKPVVAVDESEQKYIDRALATKGITIESLQAEFAKQVAAANDKAGLRCDLRKAVREPAAPKKLPEKYLAAAKARIEHKKFDDVIKGAKKYLNEDVTPASLTDAEALGWLCKRVWDAKTAAEISGGLS